MQVHITHVMLSAQKGTLLYKTPMHLGCMGTKCKNTHVPFSGDAHNCVCNPSLAVQWTSGHKSARNTELWMNGTPYILTLTSVCYSVQRIPADNQFSQGITTFDEQVDTVCSRSDVENTIFHWLVVNTANNKLHQHSKSDFFFVF